MTNRLFTFMGAASGSWRVRSQMPFIGQELPAVSFLDVVSGCAFAPTGGWSLRGITSNDRYVERAEKLALVSVQEYLGRPLATFAALIPIRKSAAWWALTKDEHEVDIRLVKNDI
jgi:hypothetical protein